VHARDRRPATADASRSFGCALAVVIGSDRDVADAAAAISNAVRTARRPAARRAVATRSRDARARMRSARTANHASRRSIVDEPALAAQQRLVPRAKLERGRGSLEV